MISGVLLIDKPAGPTSHDVVARLRRTTGERRIGHTGTLDPQATGLLPLVLGQATRLASILTGGDKTYEAEIRLGFTTDTDDAEGQPIGEKASSLPGPDEVAAALSAFRGELEQEPPQHSAKKVQGRKAYELARKQEPVSLAPVRVTVHSLDVLNCAGDRVRIRVTASAGFYVRALARDLGRRLGCGAHLATLRRTAAGPFSVDRATPLETAERLGRELGDRLLAPEAALPHLSEARLTAPGLRRVRHGNAVGPEFVVGGSVPPSGPGRVQPVKLLDDAGRLVALAHFRGGALHPVVVLG